MMDAGRTARALGLRGKDVEAAVREQAAREAQLSEWARQETAHQAAAGGLELTGAELDAETDRPAEAYPEPGEHTASGWYSAPAEEVVAPGDEPGVDAARWIPGQEHDEPGAARSPIDLDAPRPGWAAVLRTRGREPGPIADVRDVRLDEHAARAEDATQRERRATADERLAQLAHDAEALAQARQDARNARADRRAATADAYLAAARLQRSAPGPEPEDAGALYQHAAGYTGWSPGVTSRTAEHEPEAT
jgi:hypothetical protein